VEDRRRGPGSFGSPRFLNENSCVPSFTGTLGALPSNLTSPRLPSVWRKIRESKENPTWLTGYQRGVKLGMDVWCSQSELLKGKVVAGAWGVPVRFSLAENGDLGGEICSHESFGRL